MEDQSSSLASFFAVNAMSNEELEKKKKKIYKFLMLAFILIFFFLFLISRFQWASPCGVMADVLGCGPKVCGFELQLNYYVHFQINTLGEDFEPTYPLFLII